MAKVEWIMVTSTLGGAMKPVFNLDRSVGVGKANLRSDVMLVQALLASSSRIYNKPTVTGLMDAATSHAIVDFVDAYSGLKVDDPSGVVKPGFAGGKVVRGAKPRRVIEELNFLLDHQIRTMEPDAPADALIRTILYAHPPLQACVAGITIDKYRAVKVKLPPGGVISYKLRR